MDGKNSSASKSRGSGSHFSKHVGCPINKSTIKGRIDFVHEFSFRCLYNFQQINYLWSEPELFNNNIIQNLISVSRIFPAVGILASYLDVDGGNANGWDKNIFNIFYRQEVIKKQKWETLTRKASNFGGEFRNYKIDIKIKKE